MNEGDGCGTEGERVRKDCQPPAERGYDPPFYSVPAARSRARGDAGFSGMRAAWAHKQITGGGGTRSRYSAGPVTTAAWPECATRNMRRTGRGIRGDASSHGGRVLVGRDADGRYRPSTLSRWTTGLRRPSACRRKSAAELVLLRQPLHSPHMPMDGDRMGRGPKL